MLPNLGPMEMIIVMGVAVLLFGKRLPEVGRSLGKGIVEFKKGLRGFEDDTELLRERERTLRSSSPFGCAEFLTRMSLESYAAFPGLPPVETGEFGPVYTGDPERDEQRYRLLEDQLEIFARDLVNPRMLAVSDENVLYATRRSAGDVIMRKDDFSRIIASS